MGPNNKNCDWEIVARYQLESAGPRKVFEIVPAHDH